MPLFKSSISNRSEFHKMDVLNASQRLMLKQSGLGSELLDIVDNRRLKCVFQPIIDVKRKRVCAFEGLIRGPFNSALYHPLNFFKVAEEQGVLYELDTFARISTIQSFAKQVAKNEHLHLFLNISINAVMNPAHQKGVTLDVLEHFGISPERVVIEITELQPVDNFDAFITAINYYRSIGFKVAIDDLGSGYNGLRIWSEVRPDFVKIDRHFVSDIHLNDDKRMFMETLMSLAKNTNTKVVAEGVETEKELDVLTQLGVDLVQGYLFRKPDELITEDLLYEWPEKQLTNKAEKGEVTVAEITFEHPKVKPNQLVNIVSEMFLEHPKLDFFPVVAEKQVVGMVWRRDLMNLLARKFGQELHARKTISSVMDKAPIVVDSRTSLIDLSRLITDSHEFDSRAAFIVEKKKKYLGCGDFKDLLRKITDLKVESAQYANPLSGLPGNVPIQKKINKMLKNQQNFMVMYIDVDNFKPFNDNYSFEEGDGVIKLIAEILNQVLPEEQIIHGETFIGHIGGDDFVVTSSFIDDHIVWAENILRVFKDKIVGFYSEHDQKGGGIESIDRDGNSRFYPLMSLSIGILLVSPEYFEHTQKLSSYATKAKKGAKAAGGDTYFVVDSKASL